MNVKYGIKPEAYKLITGNSTVFDPANISGFDKSITVPALKNNRAAFQIILTADEDYALNVGESVWFSQHIESNTYVSA